VMLGMMKFRKKFRLIIMSRFWFVLLRCCCIRMSVSKSLNMVLDVFMILVF